MPEVIPVEAYHDLVSDDHLNLEEADAIAGALNRVTGNDVDVLYLPAELAEEKVLEPEDGTESVFVARLVPERETQAAYYARQGLGGAWVPKAATRIYVAAGDSDIYAPASTHETEGSA
ncbi:hypothetical protein [Halorussus sp. AFM4]|uniref:hypothetical protein n=1 Tax=Halorussus sp. AFM4 TaxID=3421651 RepID=UPI003EC0226B